MLIGAFNGLAEPRLAQSAKSKAFHFGARVCGECNNKRTQPSDIAFTEFDELVCGRLETGVDPGDVFNETRYAVGGKKYLNLLRYFAKVLACQIAEAGGPRILAVTEFAIARSDFNPVHLEMWPDPEYSAMRDEFGITQFAAHGGLSARISPHTGLLNCLLSSLTHRSLRYTFSVRPEQAMGLALQAQYPAFHDRCAVAYREAVAASARS